MLYHSSTYDFDWSNIEDGYLEVTVDGDEMHTITQWDLQEQIIQMLSDNPDFGLNEDDEDDDDDEDGDDESAQLMGFLPHHIQRPEYKLTALDEAHYPTNDSNDYRKIIPFIKKGEDNA